MIDNTALFDIISGSIRFQYYQRSRPIFLDLENTRPINDIRLRFFSEFDGLGRSPHDLRLYVNDIDVTDALRKTIIEILDEDTDDSIRQAYEEALNQHILVYGTVNETIEEMKEKARELLEQPLKNQFRDRIGDFTHGWSGHLGLVNFLYRGVDFPDLSMASIVTIHNTNSAQPIDLEALDTLILQFSHGQKGAVALPPRGHLSFEIIVDRENPLLKRLEAVEERIEDLNGVARDISQRITNLVDTVSQLENRVTTIGNELSATSQELHSFVEQTNNNINGLTTRTTNIEAEMKKRETMIVMRTKDGRETIRIDGEEGDIRLI